MRILISLFCLSLVNCAQTTTSKDSSSQENPDLVQPVSEGEYRRLIEANTRKSDKYAGLHQTFQADVTILKSDVQTALLKQKAHFLQWDQRHYQTERDKAVQESMAYAKFFLRFFSPESDYDDLHKGKTIWRVYLEFGGSRFEGKVEKMGDKLVEIKSLFSHFDRFSTPYMIQFNVPMNTLENGTSKVVLTSSLGTAEFSFPAGN